MKISRKLLFLILLIPGLSVLQSCSLEEKMFFAWAFLTQESWDQGREIEVHQMWLPDHVALGCGFVTLSGMIPDSLENPPNALRWRMNTWNADTGYKEKLWKTNVNMKTGIFSKSFPVPGNSLNSTRCKNWEFAGSTQVDISVTAIGGTVPLGTSVSGDFAVRDIVQLTECTPKVIPTNKLPNRAGWIKRPGASTLKAVANPTFGVKVHCKKTADGEQGTFRVRFLDGSTEIIGIQCSD